MTDCADLGGRRLANVGLAQRILFIVAATVAGLGCGDGGGASDSEWVVELEGPNGERSSTTAASGDELALHSPSALVSFTLDPVDPGTIGPDELASGPDLEARAPTRSYQARQAAYLELLVEMEKIWDASNFSEQEEQAARLELKQSFLGDSNVEQAR